MRKPPSEGTRPQVGVNQFQRAGGWNSRRSCNFREDEGSASCGGHFDHPDWLCTNTSVVSGLWTTNLANASGFPGQPDALARELSRFLQSPPMPNRSKQALHKDLTAGPSEKTEFFCRLDQVVAGGLPIFFLEQVSASPGLSMDRVASHGSQSDCYGENYASEPASVHG